MSPKHSSNEKNSINKSPLIGAKMLERILSGVIECNQDNFIKKLKNLLVCNLDKTSHPGKCWIFGGGKDKDGYGRIYLPTSKKIIRPDVKMPRNIKAHRFAFAFWRYDFNDELTIEHDCRTRSCVNPDHLYPCTHKENVRNRDKNRKFYYEKLLESEALTLPNAAEKLDKLLIHIKGDVDALGTYRCIMQNSLKQCERALVEFDTEDDKEV